MGTWQKHETWVGGKKEFDWGMALRVKSKYPSQRTNKTSKNQWKKPIVRDINPMMTVYKSEGLPRVVNVVELALFINYEDHIILLLKT